MDIRNQLKEKTSKLGSVFSKVDANELNERIEKSLEKDESKLKDLISDLLVKTKEKVFYSVC